MPVRVLTMKRTARASYRRSGALTGLRQSPVRLLGLLLLGYTVFTIVRFQNVSFEEVCALPSPLSLFCLSPPPAPLLPQSVFLAFKFS